MDEKVYIVLLNYKGYEDTMDCINSLKKLTYKNYQVIIVDNASPDDSYNRLKKDIGDTYILLQSGENGGFAKGNNVGIKYALDHGGDYILLLNNDTLVEENLIEELLKPFKEKGNIGISTGKIYYEEKRDTLWFAGGEFNTKRFYGMHIGEGERDDNKYNEPKEITFSTGCLMMIKKEVFTKVGFLPEEYFMYYEDVDFSLMVQKCGYKIYYNPKAVIYHKVSASTGGEESPFAIEWNTRNRIFIMKKYNKNLCFFYLTRIVIILKYLLSGKRFKINPIFLGIKRGISEYK
ncbi:glycosyltransferase family 2 protein [Clostridium sp. UBA5988]|uniref:glycosyltransferase family 2 protein n=1 Tax=Clostridium sp. UBA5988 TaxID=1946369 RepID=UPI003217FA4D